MPKTETIGDVWCKRESGIAPRHTEIHFRSDRITLGVICIHGILNGNASIISYLITAIESHNMSKIWMLY